MNALLSSSPRYLAVSMFCMALNIVLLVTLDRIGVHYALAVIVSAVVLIPLSYALHLMITYRAEPRAASFARYAGAQMINTPMALALFFLIHDCAGLAMIWTAPAVTGLMFLYNIASSFWAIVSSAGAPRALKKAMK